MYSLYTFYINSRNICIPKCDNFCYNMPKETEVKLCKK